MRIGGSKVIPAKAGNDGAPSPLVHEVLANPNQILWIVPFVSVIEFLAMLKRPRSATTLQVRAICVHFWRVN